MRPFFLEGECLSGLQRFALLALLPILAVCAYLPGMQGGFVFDDFVNLNALGRYGAITDLQGVLRYLASGVADPTGRPVSMLSFLLDARDWPANAAPFKWHNLVLHSLNAILLAVVLRGLGRLVGLEDRRAVCCAWIAAAAWLLHPLWVSTTLYVVQRHAMLAALFVLLGIHCWLRIRRSAEAGSGKSLFLWCAGLGLFAVLGVLSKPNAILLPVLLAVIELTLPGQAVTGLVRRLRLVLVFLPAAGVLMLLLAYGVGFASDGYARRDFTLGQRLLSEARIIWAYVAALAFPSLGDGGVFADGYRASRDWLSPKTTLVSVVALSALIACAWRYRRRWPVVSAAILFFLAGHLVESGVLPLELYFEHRNYLPSMLLFWAVVVLGARLPLGLWGRIAAALFWLSLLAGMTNAQARLWGDPVRLAFHWALASPESSRAQANWADMMLSRGRADLVAQRLTPLSDERPEDLALALGVLNARCAMQVDPAAAFARVEGVIRRLGPADPLVYRWLTALFSPGGKSYCGSLSEGERSRLLEAVLEAPAQTPLEQARQQDLQGRYALRSGDCNLANQAFERELELFRRPELALDATLLLAGVCGPAVAADNLARFRAGHGYATAVAGMPQFRDWLMARQGYWEGVFDELQSRLAADSE